VLNTATDKRQKNLDDSLREFPYVNGDLFSEHLGFAAFNRDMRNALLAATRFDWSRISPAIFGSLFQAVMLPKERRQMGGHYTSERDILKVIRSLFLDDLRVEFDSIKADRSSRRTSRLEEFHKKICGLKFLDPACGCGNFLVIAYRELRRLENKVLERIVALQPQAISDISILCKVDVDQLTGIEIEENPAAIAEVDRRMAGTHRRGGALADGPPDEPESLGGIRATVSTAPVEEIAAYRAWERSAFGLATHGFHSAMQLCPWEPAIYWKAIRNSRAEK